MSGVPIGAPAPELQVERWLNVGVTPITLAALRGRVVVIHAFQMLCPGCVLHGIPQTRRLAEQFAGRDDLIVLGLHSVFEHHAAMQPVSLAAFAHEFGLHFPIAIDRHDGDDPLPATMREYAMRGTPTTIVVDVEGRLALHEFGALDDLALGVALGRLLAAPTASLPRA